MNIGDATRQVFWNVSYPWLTYALLAPALGIATYGFYRRLRIWRRGRPTPRFGQPVARLGLLVRHALLHERMWRVKYVGAFHASLFWGCLVLLAATTVVMIDYDLGIPIMRGRFYLWFQSFVVDLFGALALVGVGLAALRRLLRRSPHLVYTTEATLILALLFLILVSGFLVEGWRIAATSDPWGAWSPVGYLVSRASHPWLQGAALYRAHSAMWHAHLLLVYGLIAWAPFTKLAHVLTAVLNIYTGPLTREEAALRPIEFDEAQSLGVSTLSQFTWKDLLDLDACTECGRCTAACPANAVGKPLSPRDLILDLRRLAHASGADFDAPLVDSTVALSREALWGCTTCGACVDSCPVAIAQFPKIIDLRRHLVMEEADLPDPMRDAVASLEARGHPFGGTRFSRMDWAQGLPVPCLSDGSECDVLLWVGCNGAFVERSHGSVRALAQLLHAANVRFGVLGREEKCTGDPARRMGHEFLFQSLARDNIATFDRHQVRTIVTPCPHCFNVFRNEYPAFGGRYEVYHHSEFLAKLVRDGRLTPRQLRSESVTFHDPCYLGRQNGVYEAPRQLVTAATGRAPVEMSLNRRAAGCCGGGGGLSFAEEAPGHRVNQDRARQALATGAEVVAVGCPFCTTMLEDGIGGCQKDRALRVIDVAELLWDSVRDGQNAN